MFPPLPGEHRITHVRAEFVDMAVKLRKLPLQLLEPLPRLRPALRIGELGDLDPAEQPADFLKASVRRGLA